MVASAIRHAVQKLPGGIGPAADQLLWEMKAYLLHRRGVAAAAGYRGRVGLRLNLGCGPETKEGWVNVDLYAGAELSLDLRQPLPLADESCSIVYSEHFLEHLDYPDGALRHLRDVFRLLQPGGIYRVGVPDTEWPLAAYFDDRDGYFPYVRENWHPAWCSTRMEHINFHFRQGSQHRFAYDFETLERALRQAGFHDICRVAFDERFDSQHRKSGTLYTEARKQP